MIWKPRLGEYLVLSLRQCMPSVGSLKFMDSPGDFVSLGMMQRTKCGWVERKFVMSLFRFSCVGKRGRNKSKQEEAVANGEERKEWRKYRKQGGFRVPRESTGKGAADGREEMGELRREQE